MNQQNNPARIRAKRILRNLFKQAFAATDTILSSDAYGDIDQVIDDTITAAVDQVGCMLPHEPEPAEPSLDFDEEHNPAPVKPLTIPSQVMGQILAAASVGAFGLSEAQSVEVDPGAAQLLRLLIQVNDVLDPQVKSMLLNELARKQ